MKDEEVLSPEEQELDTEMRALLGTDEELHAPTHDAWHELGSRVRKKANAEEPTEQRRLLRMLGAAACFAAALLAIALARPQKHPVVAAPVPAPAPEVAESANTDHELLEIDALMRQIELDELAIGLRDSGVVDDINDAFGLLREYGIDEDSIFDEYVDSL